MGERGLVHSQAVESHRTPHAICVAAVARWHTHVRRTGLQGQQRVAAFNSGHVRVCPRCIPGHRTRTRHPHCSPRTLVRPRAARTPDTSDPPSPEPASGQTTHAHLGSMQGLVQKTQTLSLVQCCIATALGHKRGGLLVKGQPQAHTFRFVSLKKQTNDNSRSPTSQ